jgi:plastocyanin
MEITMKPSKRSLFASSVVSAIIVSHVSDTAAKSGSPAPAATAVYAVANQSAVANVKIDNFSFQPKEMTVAAGTTIKGDPQVFDSGALDTDDKFSFTFSKPGTYTYYCKVHPHMTGVITVK